MTVIIVKFLPEDEDTYFVHTIERNGHIYDVWRGAISRTVYWIEM